MMHRWILKKIVQYVVTMARSTNYKSYYNGMPGEGIEWIIQAITSKTME